MEKCFVLLQDHRWLFQCRCYLVIWVGGGDAGNWELWVRGVVGSLSKSILPVPLLAPVSWPEDCGGSGAYRYPWWTPFDIAEDFTRILWTHSFKQVPVFVKIECFQLIVKVAHVRKYSSRFRLHCASSAERCSRKLLYGRCLSLWSMWEVNSGLRQFVVLVHDSSIPTKISPGIPKSSRDWSFALRGTSFIGDIHKGSIAQFDSAIRNLRRSSCWYKNLGRSHGFKGSTSWFLASVKSLASCRAHSRPCLVRFLLQ